MKDRYHNIDDVKRGLVSQMEDLLKQEDIAPVTFAIEAMHLALLSNVIKVDNNAVLLEVKKRLTLMDK